MSTCIDTGAGLELHQDCDGCWIVLEDDPSASASLLFAYHEEGCEGNDNEWHDFDAQQIAQVEEWFEEYEA